MKIENRVIVELTEQDAKHLFIPKEAEAIDLSSCEYHGFFGELGSIEVEEGNTVFYVKNNCLMDHDGVLYFAANGASIPDDGSVKVIWPFAFNMVASIRGDVRIPEGVEEIGGGLAFGGSAIKTIFIPASVKEISEGAFGRSVGEGENGMTTCPIEAIVVDEKNPCFYTQDGCLIDRKTNAVVSTYGDTVIVPNGVKTIGQLSFLFAEYRKIVIPASVETICEPNFLMIGSPELLVEEGSFAEKFLKERELSCSYLK